MVQNGQNNGQNNGQYVKWSCGWGKMISRGNDIYKKEKADSNGEYVRVSWWEAVWDLVEIWELMGNIV